MTLIIRLSIIIARAKIFASVTLYNPIIYIIIITYANIFAQVIIATDVNGQHILPC